MVNILNYSSIEYEYRYLKEDKLYFDSKLMLRIIYDSMRLVIINNEEM